MAPPDAVNAPFVGETIALSLDELRRQRHSAVAFHLAGYTLDRWFRDAEGNRKPWLFPALLAITRRWMAECLSCPGHTCPGYLLWRDVGDKAAERIYRACMESESQAQLAAWITRLRQLTELRVAQANQRRLITDPTVRASSDEVIAVLARQIRGLEQRIASLIAADPLWARLDAEFRTIKGVAQRTIARLMADLPEIGTLSSKAAAKLTGLAPMANDSGQRNGRRPIRGGRESVRSILFVVAELVRRYDTDFAAFHQRLTAAGKPKKRIRIALAHKLLTRLNAKARDIRQTSLAKPA